MKSLVSIIIPLYNAEKYISETIQSAIEQTWPNTEIIIVDDGSTDNSLAIARKYENKHIQLYTQQNKGASAARNYGLRKAKGEYIQFLDADDLLSRDKIEAQMSLLMAHPGCISMCATIHFPNGENPDTQTAEHYWFAEGSDQPTDFLVKLYGGDLIGPQYGGMVTIHAWLCPRNILDAAGPWNEALSVDDDGEYFCRVVLASKGIRYSFGGTSFYRKYTCNSNNLSGKKDYAACKSRLMAGKLKASHLLALTNNPQAKTALSRVLYEMAFNFYPYYKDLASEAETIARKYDGRLKPVPYKSFPNKQLAYLLGWKNIKKLAIIKYHGIPKK